MNPRDRLAWAGWAAVAVGGVAIPAVVDHVAGRRDDTSMSGLLGRGIDNPNSGPFVLAAAAGLVCGLGWHFVQQVRHLRITRPGR